VTGAGRKDDDNDASQAADPRTWTLPADAAVAAGGAGMSAADPSPVTATAGAGAAAAASGFSTGIPPLDKAIAALPVEDEVLEQHPEYLVAGAFATGFLLARLLKAIGG
jgi:hypothetical protein